MSDEFKDLVDYSTHLKALHSERDIMFDDMEDIFMMRDPDEERVKRTMENVKITRSPDARNKIMGALRLLIAADPTFAVDRKDNELGIEEVGNKIERFCADVMKRSGRVRKHPVHYEAVLSLLLFDEIHIGITRTADMMNYKGGSKSFQRQAEQIARTTPFLFDIYDPRTGYPDLGSYGLNALYREVETTHGALIDEYGEQVVGSKSRWSKATLCHFWDHKIYACWLRGHSKPIKIEEHGLPFIPFVVQLGGGHSLFDKVENWRQPFLYSLWRSELWKRQNLAMTVMYSMIFALGNNPIWIETVGTTGETSVRDFSVPGGTWRVPAGNTLQPVLNKGIIDPSLIQGMDLAERKLTESTIYDQALGEPLGANAAFSMVALLHQAGRLPLIMPQRMGNVALSEAVSMALQWYRQEGSGIQYTGAVGELSPDEVPEYFEIETKLDISLPQDQLQSANIAGMLASGDDPLMSKTWVRENILGIGQPDDEQGKVWDEQAATLYFRKFQLDQMARIKQLEQMAMQPEQPPMPPGQPPMPPGQLGPEMGQPMPQPGMEPQLQGLPPEMAQMGGQPIAMPGQEQMPMEGEY